MKLAWYNKILCFAALAIIVACGGEGVGPGDHGPSVSFPLNLVNNSGATATFTPENGTAIAVPAGSTHSTTGLAVFGNGDNSNVWNCRVVGGGGEQGNANVTILLNDKIALMTATWDDVNLTLTKQLK